MPKVNETWALAKSTVNYFCRLMNGARFFPKIFLIGPPAASAVMPSMAPTQHLNHEPQIACNTLSSKEL